MHWGALTAGVVDAWATAVMDWEEVCHHPPVLAWRVVVFCWAMEEVEDMEDTEEMEMVRALAAGAAVLWVTAAATGTPCRARPA